MTRRCVFRASYLQFDVRRISKPMLVPFKRTGGTVNVTFAEQSGIAAVGKYDVLRTAVVFALLINCSLGLLSGVQSCSVSARTTAVCALLRTPFSLSH